MNNTSNWLNNNQGVVAVILFVLGGIGTLLWWLFIRKRETPSNIKSPHISAGRDISAEGDIIVGGSKTNIVNKPQPGVIIKMDSFTFTNGRLSLSFENTGNISATIWDLYIGEETLPVKRFTLGPGEKTVKQFTVTGYKILIGKMTNPKIKLVYRGVSSGETFVTTAVVYQKPRADGYFNIEGIENNFVSGVGNQRRVLNSASAPLRIK